MRHAVILAGGSGTRLWPASRRARPKQLLTLAENGEAMITRAVNLARRIAGARVLIVTAEEQADATRAVVPDVEIIAEPVARNTAAAIGLAGAILAERDPNALLTILPADHHIRDRGAMTKALDACLDSVERTNAIALVGIPPTRPDTGFGYLEIDAGSADEVKDVLRFVEKPDRATAERYVAGGRHLWNAGIFCLSAQRLLSELDAHLPETAAAVRQIASEAGPVLDPQNLYGKLVSISFDHAVMEKADRVVAVPAAVGWSDVGTWSAIAEIRDGADGAGNVVTDESFVIDGSRNIVLTDDDTLIAVIGLSDLIVVKSGDAILVVRKDQAQRVREVVQELSGKGLSRYL